MSHPGGKKGNNDDDDDRKDLTRIEDLSEFLHQEDPELDNQFGVFNRPEPTSTGVNLDALDDNFNDSTPEFGETETLPEEDQLPPDLPLDADDGLVDETSEDSFAETIFDSVADDIPAEENTYNEDSEISFVAEEAPAWNMEETPPPVEEDLEETSQFENLKPQHNIEQPADEDRPQLPPEQFLDVKSFAQNFSYGKATGGGNPPYSIIVRNIKYKDDAEDILTLLREFGIVTKTNEAETIKAIQLGVLLIPQISEYCAIVLAHKFRRFDLDMEVGLSDEIHPSRSGEINPRGLVKKESLKQNRTESLNFKDHDIQINDVLVTTASALEGYRIIKHLGVQTALTIVEEDELEKLSFVAASERTQSEVYDMTPSSEMSEMSSQSAYQKFKQNYAALYENLADELKQKAFKEKANALIGLTYQLSPLHFDRHGKNINAYQITCSATLVRVMKEES